MRQLQLSHLIAYFNKVIFSFFMLNLLIGSLKIKSNINFRSCDFILIYLPFQAITLDFSSLSIRFRIFLKSMCVIPFEVRIKLSVITFTSAFYSFVLFNGLRCLLLSLFTAQILLAVRFFLASCFSLKLPGHTLL